VRRPRGAALGPLLPRQGPGPTAVGAATGRSASDGVVCRLSDFAPYDGCLPRGNPCIKITP
jgi:hypothetical protein